MAHMGIGGDRRTPYSGLGWRVMAAAFATPLYHRVLEQAKPGRLHVLPPPLWPGDAKRGEEILVGIYSLGGRTLDFDGSVAVPGSADDGWQEAYHSFGWLRDLRALGTDPARTVALKRIGGWIAANRRWGPLVWRSDILAERVCQWLQHFDFLSGSDERTPEIDAIVGSVAAQARHLAWIAGRDVGDHRAIRAFKGALVYGVCQEGGEKASLAALKNLETAVGRQIHPDGGHIGRNPAVQVSVLRDLIEVKSILAAGDRPVPPWLQGAIDRMVPLLRGMRHGDGRLALFNGANEGNRDDIDRALALAATKSKALTNAPHSGYQRLSAGRTVVIMDVGPPPPNGFDTGAHAGTLSIEMSVGRHRMVVNCGSPERVDGPWSEALRSTAAHSTLTVENVNSCEILPDGSIGRRPGNVTANRREVDGSLLVEATHDGYLGPFAILHTRSLYLAADGGDMRGEDRLSGPADRAFTIRFHLHPAVLASLVKGGGSVLLRLPQGAGWSFHASGGTVRLEESVYWGDGEAKRSEQIVVVGHLSGKEATVQWRFSAVAA